MLHSPNGEIMQIHDWARTIGVLGTMASGITAVITYRTNSRKNRDAAQAEKGKGARERLLRIEVEARKLHFEMRNGSALIDAATAVAREIENRLSPFAGRQEIERVLDNEGLMLSASIVGWHKSRAGKEISDRTTTLEVEASHLTGGFRVLAEVLQLLTAVVNDGYSPLIFRLILTTGKEADSWREVVDTHKPMREVIDQLTVALQSNASLYYVARYEKGVNSILHFIELLVNGLVSLPDDKLVGLSSMASAYHVTSATRTGAIRKGVRQLEASLPFDQRNALQVLADNIETYISKEHAWNELGEVGSMAADAQARAGSGESV